MKLHVISNGEQLEVTIAIVKEINNGSIDFFLTDSEISIPATANEIYSTP